MAATLTPGYNSFTINIDSPLEADGVTPRDDLISVKLWASLQQNFLPTESNLVFDGNSLSITISELSGGVTHYVKYALISDIDPEDYIVSSEYQVTPYNAESLKDSTPPPTPTGVELTPGISTIVIKHDNPTYTQGHGHAATLVFGKVITPGELPLFVNASFIHQFSGTVSSFSTEPSTTWRIWLKWLTVDGVVSDVPAGGTNGFEVTTGQDISLLLDAMANSISESELASSLNNRINLVDDPTTGLVFKTDELLSVFGTTSTAAEYSALAQNASSEAIQAKVAALLSSNQAGAYATESKEYSIQSNSANVAAQNAASSAISSSETASSYATDAEAAATAAQSFSLLSQAANFGAQTAATAAYDASITASAYADDSSQYANTAESKALEASTNAGNALNYRDSAATSAQSAQFSYNLAQEEAGIAVNSSANAEFFAGAALQSASTAQTYSDAAGLSASAASESSLSAFIDATSASVSSQSAVQAAQDAEGSKNAAASLLTTIKAVASNAQAVFVERWDDPNTVINWQNYGGNGEISIVTVSNAPSGSQVLRVGNASGNDQAWLIHTNPIAFDPERLYRITVKARQTSGAGTAYFGWAGVLEDKVTLCNYAGQDTDSSQHYHGASGVDIPTTWETYIGYTKGFSATTNGSTGAGTIGTPGKMHTSVRYVRPLILVNYDGAEGTTEVDSFLVEDITDVQELTSAVELLASTVAGPDGTTAQYTVKVDANGYVAGYGLSSTSNSVGNTSEFIVSADRFAVNTPTTSIPLRANNQAYTAGQVARIAGQDAYTLVCKTPGTSGSNPPTNLSLGSLKSDGTVVWQVASRVPFAVQATPSTIGGVTLPAGVYVDAAYVLNATINNAQIANAAVDDSKIASVNASKITAGSIDVGQYIQSSNYEAGSAGWRINGSGSAEFGAASIRGKLTSSQIEVSSLDALSATIGTLKSAESPNARLEITTDVIRVYDSNNVLRVKIGNLG